MSEGCALVLLRLGQKFGDLLLHGALQRRGRLGVAGLLRPQPDTRSASAKRWMQPEAGVAEGELRGGEWTGAATHRLGDDVIVLPLARRLGLLDHRRSLVIRRLQENVALWRETKRTRKAHTHRRRTNTATPRC